MWQLEAASRAEIENGTEEGLGDSSDTPLIDFPQEIQMEIDRELPIRVNNNSNAGRRFEDQMVPSMTASLVRVEEEVSVDIDSRGAVLTNVNIVVNIEPQGEAMDMRNVHIEESTAESSSSWTERDGGVVPVWSPQTISSHSESFVGDVNGGYLQRHQQTHQLMNWRQLSQTVTRNWEVENAVQPNAIGSYQKLAM